MAGAFGSRAQTPTLVADLIPGGTSSNPVFTAVFDGKLYFVVTTAAYGRELWRYDGVNAPSLVYDLNPGAANGVSLDYAVEMFVFNNNLYFSGQNASTGYELFRYDGTNPPVLVTDLVSGSVGSEMTPMALFNNKLVCIGKTAAAGRELYMYDGVSAPVLYDINPGTGDSYPTDFAEYGGKLYFDAQNAASGYELFAYTPATNAVALAADIIAGTGGSTPTAPQVLGNTLYFMATTAANGSELYSYNGSSATRLTDLNPGAGSGVTTFRVYQNKVYLGGYTGTGNGQLHVFDPANGTTALAYTLNPSGNASPVLVSVYNSKLYLLATTPTTGYELWATDGTTTMMLPEVDAGRRSSFNSVSFREYNGSLYFCAGDSATSGFEIYKITTASSGVQSVRFGGSATVYPNPTADAAQLALELTSAQTVSVALTDVTGKRVYESAPVACPSGRTMLPLPMHALSAGTYLYSLRDAGGTLLQSGPVVKQ